MRLVTALVKLARPRYLCIQLTPFVVGAIAAPDRSVAYLAAGTTAVIAWKIIASVANILSDREEDAIDHPSRTALIGVVGVSGVKAYLWGAVATYILAIVAMGVVAATPADTLLLWAVFLFGGLAYSLLGFKKSTVGVPIVLGSESAAFLWVGWHGQGRAFDWIPDVHVGALSALDPGSFLTGDTHFMFPSVLALWIFGATLCGSKDVPNLAGDSAVGYRSIYWRIVRGRHPLARVIATMAMPYAAIIAMLACGYSPPSAAVLIVGLCMPAFAVVLVRARSIEERELVREGGYLYWQVLMAGVLLSLSPEPATVVAVATSFVWWAIATRALHPDPTLSIEASVDALRNIFGREKRPPLANAGGVRAPES